MKHIKTFESLNEYSLENKIIPVFGEHPTWKLADSWEGNSGEVNFVFSNSKFEVIAEFWDPTNTYTVGFRDLSETPQVPQAELYQVPNLKTMKDVKNAMSEMMTFLDKYSN